MSFICHIHNYTEYNQQWNVFSAFNPSKCTHTWSSGQLTLRCSGSSRGFGALLKGLTSVVDNSSRSQDSNPQPRVTSLTLYPLGHDCPTLLGTWVGHPFPFRTALILRGIDLTRCWKHSSEILVHIDMIASCSSCRFVGCTSMMWISRSTTSQRCSIGLRAGDCGGHLSKVNSLSCSRNQSEMIWALWHGALSCWKYIRRYTVVIKGWTWSTTILR